MKQISTLLCVAVMAIVFTGCSDNTVGGGMLQKRKHTKGFYLNRHSSGKAAEGDVTGDVSVAKEEKAEKIRPAAKTETLVSETREPVAEPQAAAETNELAVVAEDRTPEPAMNAPRADVPSDAPEAIVSVDENAREDRQVMTQKKAVTSEQGSAAAVESALLIILLVILAFFLPWLSVLLYEGATSRFWIILLLWLLAIIGFFWPIAYALAVIAVVFAILIVLGIV